MIPLAIPNLNGNEWKYVKDCLDSSYVSSVGSYVNRFEEEFANFLKVDRAVAVVNGTASLHIALLLCGVNSKDEVLAPNLTFVAPLNAIKYTGAHPILVDCEEETLGMDPHRLQQFLGKECEFRDGHCLNLRTGKIIKALVLVHILGHSAKVFDIQAICKRYNIKLIEDASESLGGKHGELYSGTIGDFGCFSFNGNKTMTSGGGGMLISTSNEALEEAKHLTTTAKTNGLHFVHDQVGYNYRMVNVLAAIGLAQLEQIKTFLNAKKGNFQIYKEKLKDVSEFKLHEAPNEETSYWFYPLIIKDSERINVDRMLTFLRENGVDCRPLWTLMEDLPMYEGCQKTRQDCSRKMVQRVVNIPCSTNITVEEIDTVCEMIKKSVKL
jgi:perosamine synthetase